MRILLLIVVTLYSVTATAQKKQKIKGNKAVVEVFKNLEPFSELEIMDGLEVSLMQTQTEGCRLNTDSNLVDVIKFEVLDGKLKVYTTNKIVSSKKLELYITFVTLHKITLGKGAKVKGTNNFKLESLEMLCSAASDYELDIQADTFNLNMNGNANGKLKLKSTDATMVLNDNAYLKGSISADTFKLTLNGRADMNIEGSCEELQLVATGSSDVKAKKLKATNATVNASNTSDIHVYTSNNLSVYAKGKRSIYVYGNPEIKVEGLNDKSQIIKK